MGVCGKAVSFEQLQVTALAYIEAILEGDVSMKDLNGGKA